MFVACHGRIEAARLQLLVAEIFDGLEVEQTVHRLGVRLGIALVHVAADGDALLRGDEREPHIDGHGGEHDRHVEPTEIPGNQPGDQNQLDGGGDRVQHGNAHHRLDARHATLDDAVEPARAPL